MAIPGLDKSILSKYGLPTAMAAALLSALLWLVWFQTTSLSAKIEKLRDDVSFASETIDLSCQPAHPKPNPR